MYSAGWPDKHVIMGKLKTKNYDQQKQLNLFCNENCTSKTRFKKHLLDNDKKGYHIYIIFNRRLDVGLIQLKMKGVIHEAEISSFVLNFKNKGRYLT